MLFIHKSLTFIDLSVCYTVKQSYDCVKDIRKKENNFKDKKCT